MLLPTEVKIYLAVDPTDMRKAIDGLSMLVAESLELQPQAGSLFIFRNKKADKIKILYWERNGFCLWYKRLERGRFRFPKLEGSHFELTMPQLRWLLDGLDFSKLKGHSTLTYDTFF